MAKRAKKAAAPVESKVVEAAMSSGGGAGIGTAVNGRLIEQAMSDAVTKAYKDGITDSDKILKLKLAARERVKDDFRKAQAKAAKAAKAAT